MRRLGFLRWLGIIALGLMAILLLIINSPSDTAGLPARLRQALAQPTPVQHAFATATRAAGPSPSSPTTAEATRTAAATASGEVLVRSATQPAPEVTPAAPPATLSGEALVGSATQPAPEMTPTPPASPAATATQPITATAPAKTRAATPGRSPTPPSRTPTKAPQKPGATPTRPGRAYYVDGVHGSDNNSGLTPDAPWQTLAPVSARTFGPGDVINLARGSEWGGPGDDSAALYIAGSGKSDNPIIVRPYGQGDAPVLSNPSQGNSVGVSVRGQWVVLQGLLIRNARLAGVSLERGADHTVVQDNEMTAVGSGVLVWSQYNYIARNYVHDTTLIENSSAPDSNYGADGVLLHASNNEVAYNRFINCKAASQNYGADGGAVEFFGEVNNTYIHHNYSFNSDGFTEVGGGSAHSALLAYNVIVNTGPVVGLHAAGRFASDIEDFQFVNNTVVDMIGAYSLYYIEGNLKNADTLVVRNNIFNVKNYKMLLQNRQPFTHDHNLYYYAGSPPPQANYEFTDTEKEEDPMFVDLAKGDYHLRAGSPAITAGMAMDNAARDFAGTALPAGASRDLGAYQYRNGQS